MQSPRQLSAPGTPQGRKSALRRRSPLVLVVLIVLTSLCGLAITALHVTGSRRVTGPGGLLPTTIKAAKQWARRLKLPSGNLTSSLWRYVSRAMRRNATERLWSDDDDDEEDDERGDDLVSLAAVVPDELIDAEILEDGVDKPKPIDGVGLRDAVAIQASVDEDGDEGDALIKPLLEPVLPNDDSAADGGDDDDDDDVEGGWPAVCLHSQRRSCIARRCDAHTVSVALEPRQVANDLPGRQCSPQSVEVLLCRGSTHRDGSPQLLQVPRSHTQSPGLPRHIG